MPVFSRLAVAVQLVAVFLSPVLGAAANKPYDYVIVGGGVSGLIVANRITEDKSSMHFLRMKETMTNMRQKLFLSSRLVTMSTPLPPRSHTRPTT